MRQVGPGHFETSNGVLSETLSARARQFSKSILRQHIGIYCTAIHTDTELSSTTKNGLKARFVALAKQICWTQLHFVCKKTTHIRSIPS